jgi:hypothetical protein
MARSKANTKSLRRRSVNVKYRFESRSQQAQHAMTLLGHDPRNIENWLASLEQRAKITSDPWRWLSGYATH